MKKHFRFENVYDQGNKGPMVVLVDADAVLSLKCRQHTSNTSASSSFYIFKNGSEWLEFEDIKLRDDAFNAISDFLINGLVDTPKTLTIEGVKNEND